MALLRTSLLSSASLYQLMFLVLTVSTTQNENMPDDQAEKSGWNPAEEEFLFRPHSLSVALLSWSPPAVRVQWLYGSPIRIRFPHPGGSRPPHERHRGPPTPPPTYLPHRLHKFELSYQARGERYRLVLDLPSESRSARLDGLRSGAEYDLYLSAVSEQGLHNRSQGIRFLAPRTENESSSSPLSPQPAGGHSFTVREEEVIIVGLVLVVWVAVILLFFNKWGKIRMLEPYQPQYRDTPALPLSIPKAPRVSVGGGAIEALLERERFSPIPSYSNTGPRMSMSRPRQNSVFVGSPYMYSRPSLAPGTWSMPRKVKSAEDIKSLVVQITQCDVETSVV